MGGSDQPELDRQHHEEAQDQASVIPATGG